MNLENQDVFLESEENKLKEKCGILGIYLNKKDRTDSFNAAKMAYYGLYALQHRGQECAGISVSNGEKIEAHKGLGLVADVFTAQNWMKWLVKLQLAMFCIPPVVRLKLKMPSPL